MALSPYSKIFAQRSTFKVQPPPDHHPICGITMRRDCVKQHRPVLGLGAITVTTGEKKKRSSQYNRSSIVAVIIRTYVLQKVINRKRCAR